MKVTQKKIESWMNTATSIAQDSPDAERKVGALLISKKHNSILATGFNGFIRGAEDSRLPKVKPLKDQYMVHAEKNLLFNCLRNQVSISDCFVVVTLSPCTDCIRSLWQSGIDIIVYKDSHRSIEEVRKMEDISISTSLIGPYTVMRLSPNIKIKPKHLTIVE